MKKINIGIGDSERKEISVGLSRVLADTYTLYLQTQNYHWNVTGNMFGPLHVMFENQYTEMSPAIDQIAERIRTLGFVVPGTFSDFIELSSIRNTSGTPNTDKMLENIINGNESVINTLKIVMKVAIAANDEVSADLIVNRLKNHEKNTWMLRSVLGD
jgi:starvation-inducible DNA-binding protein